MSIHLIKVDIAEECEKCGVVEKITLFSQNVRGIVVVKFSTSYAAQECVKLMNGRFFGGRKIRCFFWDGETNYTVTSSSLRKAGHGHGLGGRKKESDERKESGSGSGNGKGGEEQADAGQPNLQEEEDDDEDDEDRVESSRLDEFGDWLEQEQEELPEEFRLRTE